MSVVAIVGRPNVGKSTLFNRLVGRRQSIVHNTPGVTRDRVAGTVRTDDGTFELIDTGGLVPGDDPLGLNDQVHFAVLESDLLILVVDGRQGLVPADEEVWDELRSHGRPVVVAVNKGDTKAAGENFDEFYALGAGAQVLISAEHGLGIEELIDELQETVPLFGTDEEVPESAIAVVGRPNVGKSSLINRLTGGPRSLVSPVAGTTRDPVDTPIVREDGEDLLLVDTAGIRRRSQVSDEPEELAVMMARRQIEKAQLAVLVIDASVGVTSGDLAIAGTIWELGRTVVIAVNKWDLLDEESREHLDESWERLDQILYRPLRVNISCETGRGIDRLLPAIDEALERFRTSLATSDANRLFEVATRRHQAPAPGGRPWNLLYATQVSSGPPTFMLFANRTLPRQDSYRRYLENSARDQLDLWGVPLRLVIRQRRE